MKRPIALVFAFIVVGVITYLVYEYRGDFGLGGPGNGVNPGLQQGQIVWQTVDRSTDGFQVKMPATASQTEIPAYASGGVVEQVEMIETTVEPETTYAVAWADNPPVVETAGQDAEKTLDMARDGALGRTQTSLVSESRGERNGRPSCDFVGRNAGGGILDGRLILAGTRLYMLIATFPGASARHEEDVHRFFESFSLTTAAQQ